MIKQRNIDYKKNVKFTYKNNKDFDLEQFTKLIEKVFINYLKEENYIQNRNIISIR